MTLHDVEDVGPVDVVLAYRCHTCGSAVTVEFPTAAQHAAIRYWLNRHPSRLAGALDALGMTWFPYSRATEVTGENLNDLFPERAGLKGPRRLSFDLEKFFVANVDHHFHDIEELRSEFPFEVLLCDGAMYVEKLVAERLGVPVFAVSLTTVMPDDQGPPPSSACDRPGRSWAGPITGSCGAWSRAP